jgi:hypothetical protein
MKLAVTERDMVLRLTTQLHRKILSEAFVMVDLREQKRIAAIHKLREPAASLVTRSYRRSANIIAESSDSPKPFHTARAFFS